MEADYEDGTNRQYKTIGGIKMRNIKFRGKRLDNGEWIVGNLLHETFLGGRIEAHIVVLFQDCGADLENQVHYEVDPNTAGEYTGLHDKNKVEVWESDIIEAGGTWYIIKFGAFTPNVLEDWSMSNFNKFIPDMTGFYAEVINGKSKGCQCFLSTTGMVYQVIGDIYSNPELLEDDDG